MALELVCGADVWCKLMSRGSPCDLGGPGVDLWPKDLENRGSPAGQKLMYKKPRCIVGLRVSCVVPVELQDSPGDLRGVMGSDLAETGARLL